MRHGRIVGVLSLAAACLGCAAKGQLVRAADAPREELIRSLKDFELEAGFEETDNFSQLSSRAYIDYRCYFTGKLKLPSDYYKLKLRHGTPTGCPVDDAKYDIFFYRVEAVASGHTPITPSLGKASVERTLVVVPHEDFHNDSRMEGWPTAIREAASTLVGFLAAAAFAKKEYGESSPEHLRLSREPGIFLRKAEIVNRHAARLAELYRKSRDGRIAKTRTLGQKKAIFGSPARRMRRVAGRSVVQQASQRVEQRRAGFRPDVYAALPAAVSCIPRGRRVLSFAVGADHRRAEAAFREEVIFRGGSGGVLPATTER